MSNLKINNFKIKKVEINNVIFTKEAIVFIKKLAKVLSNHHFFLIKFHSILPLDIDILEDIFEKKVAYFIIIYLGIEINTDNTVFLRYNNIINTSFKILNDVFMSTIEKFPSIDDVDGIVNSYPISIMYMLSNKSYTYSYMIGQSVKNFIKCKFDKSVFIPITIYNSMENIHISMVNLNEQDLITLKSYLNSNKQSHLYLLINCLTEFNYHYEYIIKETIEEDMLLEILNSSWLYLLLLYII
jgi:hypothetical protein